MYTFVGTHFHTSNDEAEKGNDLVKKWNVRKMLVRQQKSQTCFRIVEIKIKWFCRMLGRGGKKKNLIDVWLPLKQLYT